MLQKNLQRFFEWEHNGGKEVTLKGNKGTYLLPDELYGYHHIFPFCDL